jgi:ribonuclease Z
MGADLLVHEATFTSEDRDRAIETRHSTAEEAGTLARDAGVRMLALTHISTRVQPREVRREAERIVKSVVVPRDFDQVEIPFRERGEPRLVPVQERLGRGAREDGQAAAEAPATLPDATL